MKKVLAYLAVIGLMIGSLSGMALSAGNIPDPADYDDIPVEWLPLPVH